MYFRIMGDKRTKRIMGYQASVLSLCIVIVSVLWVTNIIWGMGYRAYASMYVWGGFNAMPMSKDFF